MRCIIVCILGVLIVTSLVSYFTFYDDLFEKWQMRKVWQVQIIRYKYDTSSCLRAIR